MANSVSALVKAGVVPNIIDIEPQNKIQVTYPSGAVVEDGNYLTPSETRDEPSVNWSSEIGQWYTLVMTDPDVPIRSWPFLGEFKHWLVVNIPGSDLAKGRVVARYEGPGPPPFTGLHRYVFLVYKQLNKYEDNDEQIATDLKEWRIRWSVRNYAQTHNLGHPIAYNFFLSKR